MKRKYTVAYQTIEDGWIMASVPELPGAVTQGRNMEEARSMIKEAVELLLASSATHGSVSRDRSDIESQMAFTKTNLGKIEKIPTEEIAVNVGAAETNLQVE